VIFFEGGGNILRVGLGQGERNQLNTEE
jgi:hypothetical protein